MIVAFVSYGNDSIALLQFLAENEWENVVALHSDTGWAAPWWKDRVADGEEYARHLGFRTERTESVGMMDLVRSRKGWPRQGMQFCTAELKILPAVAWLEANDPEAEAVCAVGIRRQESAARSRWPEYQESDRHGGRELWSPLVRHTTEMRDDLIRRAGFNPLPHRSMECYPCVNANQIDLRALTDDRVAFIEQFENELGVTKNGKPRTMFRAGKKLGATGIRQVVAWAWNEHERDQLFLFGPGAGCDSGMCAE